MSSSASVTLFTNYELEKLFQNRSDLKIGDKLEGKILEVRDNGKAVIDFGNFQAEVDLKFPVEKGDVIRLIVLETGKQLKLKIEQVETKSSQEITNLLKEADVQQEKSLEELAARIDQLLQKELKNLESGTSGKSQDRVLEDIGKELAKLKEHLQTRQPNEPIPKEIRQEVEQLLKNIENTLQRMPESTGPEGLQRLERLSYAIRDLRTTIDAQQDFKELQDKTVKEIVQLKSLAEALDGPARQEVEAIINKLSIAAEKISRLEGPEQLPELRRLLSEEITPNLKALDEIVKQQAKNIPPESTEQRQLLEIGQRTEQLQRDIAVTMQKMPDSLPSLKQMEPLLQKIELALSRIPEAPQRVDTPPEVPQFSEDIQAIYENIKNALRLLQNNLRISGDQLEIPEQIRQVFLNLQSDLKASEATTNVLEQMTRLKEMMAKADLPIEKVVKEFMDSLTEMMNRIKELKDQNNFTEIRELVQHRLGPQLKMMGELFGNEKLLGLLDGKDQVSSVAIRNAVREIQEGIESAFVRGESSGRSSELAQLMEMTDKLSALSSGGKGEAGTTKTSETIAQLSKNIEEFLARLPNTAATQDSGSNAIADKIKSLLATLQAHFEPLDLGQDALSLVPRLKALVENSGLFFEKKLGDILDKLSEASSRIQDVRNLDQLPEIRSIIEKDMKPNLLQLREQLADDRLLAQLGDSKTLENMRAAVQDLLSQIGSQQDRAVDNFNQQSQMQLFSFHVPIKGEESAELKVFYNKSRKKDSPEEFKLSLLLDMSKLGEVRSDFFSLKEDLSITFYVSNDRIKDFFMDHIDDVENVLKPVFKNLNVNIIVSQEKAATFTPEEAEDTGEQFITDKAVNVKI